jgi:hypothetical protein
MSAAKQPSRRLKKERDFRPHAEHYHAASVFYDNASKSERGSALQLQAALVFCAFCVEAYLNHMGRTCLARWDDVERAPVFAKLRLLLSEFSVHLAPGERPLQTIRQLFRYRDWMAHSKSAVITEELEYEGEIDESTRMATPKHKWEDFNTLANTRRCLDDVAALVKSLNEKAPVPDRSLLIVTSHSYSDS